MPADGADALHPDNDAADGERRSRGERGEAEGDRAAVDAYLVLERFLRDIAGKPEGAQAGEPRHDGAALRIVPCLGVGTDGEEESVGQIDRLSDFQPIRFKQGPDKTERLAVRHMSRTACLPEHDYREFVQFAHSLSP